MHITRIKQYDILQKKFSNFNLKLLLKIMKTLN